MEIPAPAAKALGILESRGYAAYLVGGCVRDTLLGRVPGDWDICTAARPEQTQAAFAAYRRIETGLRHGTVTVLIDGQALEITTFRQDGAYSDARHPDSVRFTPRLEEDLARRDFTCNAMACTARGELLDPFGGQEDLRRGVLRCVGDARERFSEDALRLLRALRFAARYSLTAEPETARALHEKRALLQKVSAERVYAELCGLVCAPGAAEVLREYADVLFVALPELAALRGFEHHSDSHTWDIWEHTLHALAAAPPELAVRLALLFHDAGKPDTRVWYGDHCAYPNHPAQSRQIAAAALARLRCDRVTQDAVLELVALHEKIPPHTLAEARRELAALGETQTRRLYAVRIADAIGHGTPRGEEKLAEARAGQALMEQVLAQGGCLSLRELAVGGEELLALGFPRSPALGAALAALLDAVLDGELPNERGALLARARTLRPNEVSEN